MLIGSAMTVVGPYLVKVALDSGIEADSIQALQRAVLLYLVVAVVQWIVTFARVNIMARVGQSIIFDLRARLFEHLQELSLSFFSHYSVGRVITRVINDVGVLRQFIAWAALAIARDLFALVGILVVMLAMNVRLSLLTFTVIPLMIAATVIFRKKARENYRKVRQAISWVNSVLAENINGVRVVQAFSREAINYAQYHDVVNRNNLDTNLRAVRVAAAYPSIIEFLGALATGLVVWLGAVAVLGEQVTPGVLVAFILYIDRFFEPIRDLSRRYDEFQSTMASSERIFALMDTEVEVKDAPLAIEMPSIEGEVRFENVSFHYADDPTLVLQDINLNVRHGETVALGGRDWCG
jgi:ATP-binding cassette, subfamily B, multidrug efflux pump